MNAALQLDQIQRERGEKIQRERGGERGDVEWSDNTNAR